MSTFDKSLYLDFPQIYTYNCLFNFLIGGRGVGKTYGAKKKAAADFINKGYQFIYVRRFKTETKKAKKNFWKKIILNNEFPDHELTVKNDIAYIDGKVAGYFETLSTSKILKSSELPEVRMIIFDEFLIEKSTYHYLPGEVETLLDLYDTVDRSRDETKIFFISNAVSFTNPYFLYFNIPYPNNKKKIYRKNDIFLQLYHSEEFQKAKEATRFGKMIKGTKYGDYNLGNQFIEDSRTFIEKKGEGCSYQFTFYYKDQIFGVWTNYKAGKMFISYDYDPTCRIQYSLTMDDHRPNMMIIKNSRNTQFKYVLQAYKEGYCYFESLTIKNQILDVLKTMLV